MMTGACSKTVNRRRRFAAAERALALTLTALAVAGCQTVAEGPAVEPYQNDYRLRHPISVLERNQKMVLFIGTNRGGLTPMQRAEVVTYAQTWKRESSGGIVIDVPNGTANERAAADASREVLSLLAAADVPPNAYQIRPYHAGSAKLAPIKLNYPRVAADAGPCGLWPHDLGPSEAGYLENRPYYNFGCASQRNLAAMVDNPADLVQPRGETPAYTPRRTVVLDKYRKGESTQTTYLNPNKGRISDVGQ
jgi:pilus assembly protein CpaD